MLWIALFLPELPLQLAQRALPEVTRALVIAEGPELRPLVCCANALALEQGVQPGMPVAAARALAGELVALPRNPQAEAQALGNLACWAGQFTPRVQLLTAGLLLEVASTLRLHGGLPALLKRLRAGLRQLGYVAQPGVAPTPLAAWWLARARHAGLPTRPCRQLEQLAAHLAPLPLVLLDWPEDVLQTFESLGIRQLGACLQLPRDGFIRRFGQARRLELDRALGLCPDPRPWFEPPEQFSSRLEFGFELNDTEALLFPLQRLLGELEGFLRSRGAGVQRWQLQLEHWNHGRSSVVLGTSLPERNARQLLSLAREKLSRLELQAPVLALTLQVDALQTFEEQSHNLVADERSRALDWQQLVDRLSLRLGSERLYRLARREDHRPEHSWQRLAPVPARKTRQQQATAETPAAPRPLWLLNPPRLLSTSMGHPLCQGRLDLLAGPERIESGWWDGQAVRRDYYVARNPRGETLWVYRELRQTPAWYLHGIFA